MIIEDARIQRGKDGRPELFVRQWEYFLEQMAEEWLSADREYEDLFLFAEKQRKDHRTIPQLRYLYGHLAPMALKVLRELGWNTIRSKEAAISVLKTELGFCEVIENEKTHGVVLVPKSLSLAARENRKEISEFIDRVFAWLIDAGCQPVLPEEYEQMRKVKK